jgi:hypothetical protein
MIRVGKEVGALSALMVLSLFLRMAAEDPENEDIWTLQMANYWTFRSLQEMASVQTALPGQAMDAVDSPFVGWGVVKNLLSAGDLFDSSEVQYGTYRGMTQRGKFLTRMVPGFKQYFDLRDMNQTYETYKFYNLKNFEYTPANLLWLYTIDAEE